MNNEITENEITELSNKLNAKFSKLNFEQEMQMPKSSKSKKRGLTGVASVAAAVVAFVAFSPSGTTTTWASEPTVMSEAQMAVVQSNCQSMAASIGVLETIGNKLPETLATDFRAGVGFSIYRDEATGITITCNFEQTEDNFLITGFSVGAPTSANLENPGTPGQPIMIKTGNTEGNGSSEVITSNPGSKPKIIWNGEKVVSIFGELEKGATKVELRSEKYPTWRATLVGGSSWAMLVPASAAGTLVQLNDAGDVILESPFDPSK